MTPDLQIHLMRLGMALIAGMVVPMLGMRYLIPSLGSERWRVTNYRGVDVPLGLGVVWAFWAMGVLIVMAPSIAFEATEALEMARSAATPFLRSSASVFALMPATMVLGVFVFGLVDDVWGSGSSRGFKGHAVALKGGLITTGMLKALGIGAFALFGAAQAVRVRQGFPAGPPGPVWETLLLWMLATLAIALSANLVNLFDLRPGRALKVYSVLSLSATTSVWLWPPSIVYWFSEARNDVWASWMPPLFVAMMLVGPALAVWRSDLSERAMLGDSGANPAGALVGYLIAATAPIWVLGAYTAVVLLMNLISERISFSAVIEGNAVLRRLDMLGREPSLDETPAFPDER